MTLRTRLTLAFLGVVLVPLIAAAVFIQLTVPGAARDQRASRLNAEAASVVQGLAALCDRASALARATALESLARTPAQAAQAAVAEGGADFAVVSDPSRVLATFGEPVGAMTVRGCVGGARSSTVIVGESAVASSGGKPAERHAVVGFVIDRDLLIRLRPSGDFEVVSVAGGAPLAATAGRLTATPLRADLARALRSAGPVHASDQLLLAADAPRGLPFRIVVTTPIPPQTLLPWLLAGAVVLGGVAAWLLGRRLAAVTTAPLDEVVSAATRIADGDFLARVPVRGRDEVGELATAFNAMTERLHFSFGELSASRDQLRRDLSRLGETLTSTHDLTRILGVILDTALEAARASAGAVFLTSPSRTDLFLKVGRGLEGRGVTTSSRIPFGEGALGRVAATGEAAAGAGLSLHSDEPTAEDLIAVPLRAGGQVIGVLAVYDRVGSPFRAADLDTIATFAGQASVAVDNVLLHQEAQRLSVTDAMTGLSNYRAFQRQLAREVERALRFKRPLGLLLLDLDLFKAVNDTYGHQVGDAVLIELSRRVEAEVRDVDQVARYGGEELVIVLPETDAEGAALLAERVCAVVRERPFVVDGVDLVISVSIGAAALPDHAATASDLLGAADEAMYAAKSAGRDTWRLATPH